MSETEKEKLLKKQHDKEAIKAYKEYLKIYFPKKQWAEKVKEFKEDLKRRG